MAKKKTTKPETMPQHLYDYLERQAREMGVSKSTIVKIIVKRHYMETKHPAGNTHSLTPEQ